MAAVKGTRPPNAGKGRKKGVPNKVTTELKDAILKAAELCGEDGKGKDGLIGYLTTVARSDVKAFSGLLGRVLPLQVTGESGQAIPMSIAFVIQQAPDSENRT